ncbi:hypothetical protein I5Q34_34050 [Streptomyces sp. AV19]|uniref:hypothetical protein n=1 Tax=Streptomyces sp. AV19 TaxID=2793068 RepID=UPI0018FED016|nr:hypothetical protein [Streptomyces sp. AV19]MBH1939224.1 hypothetical protein [Streptomyces sp. AV19]MDG4537194.1 hypothetical protein [Streptomyces sp. AV19]
MTVVAAVAALLAGACAEAGADADIREGAVGLTVRGRGLHVSRVAASVDGHPADTRGRLVAVGPDGYERTVRGWTYGRPVSAGMTRLTVIVWRINRTFEPGTRLCAEFSAAAGRACAVIHRAR